MTSLAVLQDNPCRGLGNGMRRGSCWGVGQQGSCPCSRTRQATLRSHAAVEGLLRSVEDAAGLALKLGVRHERLTRDLLAGGLEHLVAGALGITEEVGRPQTDQPPALALEDGR